MDEVRIKNLRAIVDRAKQCGNSPPWMRATSVEEDLRDIWLCLAALANELLANGKGA